MSGRRYLVSSTAGRPAGDIADFVGDTWFVIEGDGSEHTIAGLGARAGDGVRFYQKDPFHDGRDVRVWLICDLADGGFFAEHEAAI